MSPLIQAMANRTWVRRFLYGVALLVVSLGVSNVMTQIHAWNHLLLSDLARDITTGHAPRLAFQNRLLGPHLISLISRTGLSYDSAFTLFTQLAIVIQNVLLFALVVNSGVRHRTAFLYVCLYSLLFLCVQNTWLYPWDLIDAVVFTLFAYGIFRRKPAAYFFWLFLPAIANREDGLFISLYMMLAALRITRSETGGFTIEVSRRRMALGAALLIAGVAYVALLRHFLYVGSPARDAVGGISGNETHLLGNVRELLLYSWTSPTFAQLAFLMGSPLYLTYFARRYDDAQWRAFAVYLILLLNILIFGVVHETRLFIILLPFVVFFQIEIDAIVSDRPPRRA